MSHLTKLKVKLHYEKDVPRCQTCKHFRPSHLVMTTNSRTMVQPPLCGRHSFLAKPTSVCDTWVNKKGETLEPIYPPKKGGTK